MKNLFKVSGLLLVCLWQSAQATVFFTNENDGTHEPVFYIDSADTNTGFIDLEFGRTLDARLRFDVANDLFEVNRDLYIKNEIVDSDGNTGANGQVLIADGSGKNLWGAPASSGNVVPFISNTIPGIMSVSQTQTITYTGENFLPTSIISIPSFPGTLNSTSILSPTSFEINITSNAIAANYDLVVSNSGTSNTTWPGNGVGLLSVRSNDGSTATAPGESCKEILDNGYSLGDGTYWIDPNGGVTSDSFQAYCDMTTSGGGWTRIDYAADLTHEAQFAGADTRLWLDDDFTLTLTDTQIDNIRSVSTEGKQTYVGSCQGVIHYLYQANNYTYAFGFRYHDGHETAFGQQTYPSTNISVPNDGCVVNNNTLNTTTFEIQDLRVPVINVSSRDNSNTEQFGADLLNNPAWLR